MSAKKTEKKETQKRLKIKDELFVKNKIGTDRSKNVEVIKPVDFIHLGFKGQIGTFYKGKALTEKQLLLFDRLPNPEYSKEYYLTNA